MPNTVRHHAAGWQSKLFPVARLRVSITPSTGITMMCKGLHIDSKTYRAMTKPYIAFGILYSSSDCVMSLCKPVEPCCVETL